MTYSTVNYSFSYTGEDRVEVVDCAHDLDCGNPFHHRLGVVEMCEITS